MSEKNPSASKTTGQRQEKKAVGSRDIKDCFGETPKPARGTRALPYGFGGAAGFAASPGFGGAPPADAGPPGRSSSGAARISCSTNDSG